jgi:hypothetical protein
LAEVPRAATSNPEFQGIYVPGLRYLNWHPGGGTKMQWRQIEIYRRETKLRKRKDRGTIVIETRESQGGNQQS